MPGLEKELPLRRGERVSHAAEEDGRQGHEGDARIEQHWHRGARREAQRAGDEGEVIALDHGLFLMPAACEQIYDHKPIAKGSPKEAVSDPERASASSRRSHRVTVPGDRGGGRDHWSRRTSIAAPPAPTRLGGLPGPRTQKLARNTSVPGRFRMATGSA